MIFGLPNSSTAFEIPDEWWTFCGMGSWRRESDYYPYPPQTPNVEIVELAAVEPPRRDAGVAPFKKYKLVPILLAFQSPECTVPPIKVRRSSPGTVKYTVQDGYHRFYASTAARFTQVPTIVIEGGVFP